MTLSEFRSTGKAWVVSDLDSPYTGHPMFLSSHSKNLWNHDRAKAELMDEETAKVYAEKNHAYAFEVSNDPFMAFRVNMWS